MFGGGSPFTPRNTLVTPNTTPGLTPKRRIMQDSCPYCLEPLSNIIENELIIELQCLHSIHLNCLLLLTNQIDLEDDEITCPECNDLTRPIMDISRYKQNLEDFTYMSLPVTPNEQLGTPVTPQEQMGPKFWQKDKVLESVKPDVLDLNNNEIDLAKVIISPQYSSIESTQLEDDDDEIYCTVQISTTKFESVEPINAMRNETLKFTIIGSLIRSWPFQNNIDVNDLQRGLMFDYFDEISIGGRKLYWCQMHLFETAILLIQNNELILNQYLDVNETFISSIFTSGDEIIINLNSLKTPEIKVKSNNKILIFKWVNILKRFIKKDNQFKLFKDVPLIQLTTNAWPLVEQDYLPADIEIINKLLKKGMDLPSGFLQRQLIKPDPIPLKLVLVVPLFNVIDGQWTNEEYSRLTQKLIKSTLESLNEKDLFGVIFIQNERKDLMGSYYGCGNKNWDGWDLLIESITEEVITGLVSGGNQWIEGLEILQLLSNIFFNDDKYVNEVIFVSNELNNDVKITKMKEQNPFDLTKISESMNISDFIKELSKQFKLQFNILLLTDEYTFKMSEIWKHFESLKINGGEMTIVLDYEDLSGVVDKLIFDFHEIIIKEMKINFTEQNGVKIQSSEFGSIDYQNFQLRNIKSGFIKSFLMKLEIDKGEFQGGLINSHVEIDNEIKFDSKSQMKIVSNEVLIDKFQLVNPNKSMMNIFPQLSNTPNGVFLKRQIERLIMDRIFQNVINIENFDSNAKRIAHEGFRILSDEIWELFNGCNTTGIDLKIMENWVDKLIDDIELLNEGFNLRNIDLAMIRWVIMYLKFI